MGFYNKTKNFIFKLQGLSEGQKKIIFFTAISFSAVILFFLWITFSLNNLSTVGSSLKSINLPKVDFPEISLPSETDLSGGEVKNDEIAGWQTYKNEKYNFTLNYPPNKWEIKENSSEDILLEKISLESKEVIDIHISVVSQTQKIKSSEEGINKSISQIKDIIKPKEKINIGDYEGYEVIGTICTKVCNGSSEDVYSPFSIIYFSDRDVVIKIKYGEGTMGVGWKDKVDSWKYYDEFKNIISNFKFSKELNGRKIK